MSVATRTGALGSSHPHAGHFASSIHLPRLYTPTIRCLAGPHRPSHWKMPCGHAHRKKRNILPSRQHLKSELRLHHRFHRSRTNDHRRGPQQVLWGRRKSARNKGTRIVLQVRIAVAASTHGSARQCSRFHHGYRSARTCWRTFRRGRLLFSLLSLLHCKTVLPHLPRLQPRVFFQRGRPGPTAASTKPSRA